MMKILVYFAGFSREAKIPETRRSSVSRVRKAALSAHRRYGRKPSAADRALGRSAIGRRRAQRSSAIPRTVLELRADYEVIGL